MAKINGIELDHFPLLGNTSLEFLKIDLSKSGDISKVSDWRQELYRRISNQNGGVPYGGYLEKRFFYSNEELFGKGETNRDIHLGVDLWVGAGTKIYCPSNGIVHSMAYNKNHLDYGYTIILKHELEEISFYTLYGHLSDDHISSLKANDTIEIGKAFCKVGNETQNGNWPPHLHFQVILEIGKHKGDYPGVCNKQELEYYQKNCPDGSSFII